MTLLSVGPLSCAQATRLLAGEKKANGLTLRGFAERPNPGRSSAITRWSRARSGRFASQFCQLPPSPWTASGLQMLAGGAVTALWALLTGERDGYYADFGSVAHLAMALEEAFVYAGRYSPFRDRVHGRSPAGIPGYRFLGYIQNHDQVGNRARGDRRVRCARSRSGPPRPSA